MGKVPCAAGRHPKQRSDTHPFLQSPRYGKENLTKEIGSKIGSNVDPYLYVNKLLLWNYPLVNRMHDFPILHQFSKHCSVSIRLGKDVATLNLEETCATFCEIAIRVSFTDGSDIYQQSFLRYRTQLSNGVKKAF